MINSSEAFEAKFAEFPFHVLRCITDILRRNDLYDWIGALA
jgi:hypothetical protein